MSQNHKNGLQKSFQNSVPKKHQTIMIFSTLKCGSSVVNTSKINHFHVLVLTTFWVSLWRCLGAQMEAKAIKKPLQKNIKNMMPNMSPNWSQRGSQIGAQIVKSEVLEAPCFKGGSQVASRPLPGSILEVLGPIWDHFRY